MAEAAAPDTVAIYRAWIEAANDARWADVAAALSDDVSLSPASSGMTLTGKDNVLEFFKSFAVGFPDLRTTPLVVVTRPGHLIAVARSSGTNSAAVGPFPATHREISFVGLTHVEFDTAGTIKQVIAYADNLNFMGQMGQWEGATREATTPAKAEPEVAAQESSALASSNLAVARKYIDAFNRHDAPAMLGLFAPDALFDDQHLAAPIITASEIAAHHSNFFPSFPDIAMTNVTAFAAGDYVVLEYNLRGTHGGKYARLPGPPSYRQIELQAAALLRVRGDRITSHTVFVDGMALGFQLGLIAVPGAEPPPTP